MCPYQITVFVFVRVSTRLFLSIFLSFPFIFLFTFFTFTLLFFFYFSPIVICFSVGHHVAPDVRAFPGRPERPGNYALACTDNSNWARKSRLPGLSRSIRLVVVYVWTHHSTQYSNFPCFVKIYMTYYVVLHWNLNLNLNSIACLKGLVNLCLKFRIQMICSNEKYIIPMIHSDGKHIIMMIHMYSNSTSSGW